MSAIRKIAVSVSALFLGLSALFLTTAPAAAEGQPYTTQCDSDWHNTCP